MHGMHSRRFDLRVNFRLQSDDAGFLTMQDATILCLITTGHLASSSHASKASGDTETHIHKWRCQTHVKMKMIDWEANHMQGTICRMDVIADQVTTSGDSRFVPARQAVTLLDPQLLQVARNVSEK